MNKSQQYRGEALRRGQQFLEAHPDVFKEVNGSEARASLDRALEKLDAAVDVQLARAREARGEAERVVALETELRDQHMTPVSKFAKGQLAGTPELVALTPAAGKLVGAPLVKAARGMAVAAQPHAKRFRKAAFPESFVLELTNAANALQAAIHAGRAKRAARVNATSVVEEAIREARAAWLMIEGAVGRVVKRGTPLHREWTVIRRIAAIPVRAKDTGQDDAEDGVEGGVVAGSIGSTGSSPAATTVAKDAAA